FSSRRRHTIFSRDWSSDVCSSDLPSLPPSPPSGRRRRDPCPASKPALPPAEQPQYRSGEGAEPPRRRDTDADRPASPVRENRTRSEERRVGKEGISRWDPDHIRNN